MSRDYLEKKLSNLYDGNIYYAALFFRVQRIEMKQCPTMGVGVQDGRVKLVYNPEFMKSLDDKSLLEVLKHEALHLQFKHVLHQKGITAEQARLFNIAMDCSINQFLDQSIIDKIGGITLKSFGEMVGNKHLKTKQTWQYYYSFLKKEYDKRKAESKEKLQELLDKLEDMEMDSHDMFGQGDESEEGGDSLDQLALDNILSEAAKEAKDKVGKLPNEVEDLYDMLRKPKLQWKRLIKQFVGNSLKTSKKRTRSKLNRRYGIVFQGIKKNRKARLLVGLDTSGSMYGSRTDKVLNEIYGIYKAMNIDLDIAECDAKIQDVFKYDGKQKFKISGRGGTELAPLLKYGKENNYDGVIILTDLEIWQENFEPYKDMQVLWVVSENDNAKAPFGRQVNIPEDRQ